MHPLARTLLTLPLLVFCLIVNPLSVDSARAQGLLALFGWPDHLPYPRHDDAPMARIGGLYLKPAAAAAFARMARDAQAEGVYLVVRSALRSLHHQSRLFYGGARTRRVSLKRRARVSAPPGFSEHHTGYAIDIDDARNPRWLRQSFERTRAGQWLMHNAARYCFELSFPRDNIQGIAYEPWHWRFVGSADALRTFAAARWRYPAFPATRLVREARANGEVPICEGLPPATAAPVLVARDCTADSPCPETPDQLASADLLPEELKQANGATSDHETSSRTR